MPRILVTPEEVHNVANQFAQASQESQDMVGRLEGIMGNLEPQWEGMAKQRFYQEYQNWRNNMRGFVDLLNQISQELHAIADRFAAADQP